MSKNSCCIFFLLLFLIPIAYMLLVIGIIEHLIFIPNRSHATQQLEKAVQLNPPDVDYILERVDSPDWFVAAAALHHIANMKKSDVLSPQQTNEALNIVFENLGKPGRWWRFGWDMEERGYSQFLGQSASTAALFGPTSLPLLKTLSKDSHPTRRASVCNVFIEIPNMVIENNDEFWNAIKVIVHQLAEFDSNSDVSSTCNYALRKRP